MNRRSVLLATLLAALAMIPLWFVARGPSGLDDVSRAHVEEPEQPLLETDARPTLVGREVGAVPRATPRNPAGTTTAAAPTPRRRASEVSFRLETVDAETGRPVNASWMLERHHELTDGDPWRRSGAVFERAFMNLDRVASYGDGRNREDVTLLVRPPDAYVTCLSTPRIAFERAAGVRETWALEPLAREAVLDLRLVGLDGRPAEGALLLALEVGRQRWPVRTEALGRGELRVRGIPFLPGEPVLAAVGWAPRAQPQPPEEIREETEEATEARIHDPDLTTTIPTDLGRGWHMVVRQREPVAGAESLTTDNDMPFEESLGAERPDKPSIPRASLRVRALDWEGRPLAGISIGGSTTDADGGVLIWSSEGKFTARMREPGRFAVWGRAELTAQKTPEIVLREPVGTRLEVLVTDEEGNPRPCARLTVSGTVFDVVDGVQRLDMFTDHRGRRTLARVEPGQRTVRATWGSRSGSQDVLLPDGETVRLTIVAK